MFEPLRLDPGIHVELLDESKKSLAAGTLKDFRELADSNQPSMEYRLNSKVFVLTYPHWVRLADGTEYKIGDHGFVIGSNFQK
jgi:hypothetical protein